MTSRLVSYRKYKAVTKPLSMQGSLPHVIVMHGLLGCYRNWHAVCCSLASPPKESTAMGFPCVAFDWRNHGGSFHAEEHSLDALADDLEAFLTRFSQQAAHSDNTAHGEWVDESIDIGKPRSASHDRASSSSTGPLPVVLMAHSMGGAALMHALWRSYAANGPCSNFLSNGAYRVVGCVVVDIAPCPRPPEALRMMEAARFLSSIPLDTMHATSMSDVEQWLLQHGPKPYFSLENIWMVKYFVSNIAFSRSNRTPPQWKIGIHEICNGIDRLHWMFDNTSVAGNGGPLLPPMPAPAVKFIFGGASPYHNASSVESIPHYFQQHSIDVIDGGSHFMFMEKRNTFCENVRGFLQNACGAHCAPML